MVEIGRDLSLIRPHNLMKLAGEKEIKPGHFLTRQEALLALLADLVIVAAEELLF